MCFLGSYYAERSTGEPEVDTEDEADVKKMITK